MGATWFSVGSGRRLERRLDPHPARRRGRDYGAGNHLPRATLIRAEVARAASTTCTILKAPRRSTGHAQDGAEVEAVVTHRAPHAGRAPAEPGAAPRDRDAGSARAAKRGS